MRFSLADTIMILAFVFLAGFTGFQTGAKQGLREQDSKVITELRQNNQKLIQVVNFAIKQDTTGSVSGAARKVGLIK